jgi:uncharacterized protein
MARYPNLPQLRLRVGGRTAPLRVFHARSFVARLFGLLGGRRLAPDEALLLEPCSSVHTFGMRYPIDVVMLDEDGRVLATRSALQPLRLAAARRTCRVLELPPNSLASLGIAPGAQLTLEAA